MDLDKLVAGQTIRVPPRVSIMGNGAGPGEPNIGDNGGGASGSDAVPGSRAVQALLHAQAAGDIPEDGLVAVKVLEVKWSAMPLFHSGLWGCALDTRAPTHHLAIRCSCKLPM